MLTVKEVSKVVDLSEHTIRYYTDKGLIPMIKRDKNNNRVFDDECIGTLITIKCLKDTGMPLDEIKKYIHLYLEGESTFDIRYKMIVKQYEIAKKQLLEAEDRVEFLKNKVALYESQHK